MRMQIVIPEAQFDDPADYLECVVDQSGIVELPKDTGLVIRIAPKPARRAFPGAHVMVLFAEFTSGIAGGVLSNWIYDHLRTKTATILIDNRPVSPEKKEEVEDAIKLAEQKQITVRKHKIDKPHAKRRKRNAKTQKR